MGSLRMCCQGTRSKIFKQHGKYGDSSNEQITNSVGIFD